ncbi:hypothetical protein HanPI659440_Chr17g0686001 [Helianthus annuus]|nr:hypothetical protein HanPI659440_Chr17g0686001 [Helianthus annuus]
MALEELEDSTYLSRFTGYNPARWICDAERFFSFYAIYEEERFPYVVESFDDEPFSWFNSWYRGPECLTWKSFTIAMLHHFLQPPSLPCHEPPIPPTSSFGRVASPPTLTPSPQQSPLGSIYPQSAIITNKTSIPVLYPFVLFHGHVSFKNRCSKFNDANPNAIGKREWRPPWLPPCRYVETDPNAVVRLEWRPPWTGQTVVEDKDVFQGESIDTCMIPYHAPRLHALHNLQCTCPCSCSFLFLVIELFIFLIELVGSFMFLTSCFRLPL